MNDRDIEKGGGAGLIVDVRSEEEFEEGHASGAINVPLDDILADPKGSADRIRAHARDSAAAIRVCCASGGRSAIAASLLKKEGIENAKNCGGWQGLCD